MTPAVDFASFCDVLAVELDLPSRSDETMLTDETVLDSLLRFEILMLVEEWAGVMLPEALIGQLRTLTDFYDIYVTRVAQADQVR